MYRGQHKFGFTIVELLIVIVVIAIMAAITIVAYNGIQQRAKTAVINSAVQEWEQTIKRAYVEGFVFPDGESCLGRSAADFPAATGFGLGVCGLSNTNGNSLAYNPALFAGWPSTVVRPNGLLPSTKFQAEGFDMQFRGVTVYVQSADRLYQLSWIPQVSGECGSGTSALPGSSALSGGYCFKHIQY